MIVHVVVALARIPLASWAVSGSGLALGLDGIAWTMSLTCVFRSAILAGWFARGQWMDVELPTSRQPIPSPEDPAPSA